MCAQTRTHFWKYQLKFRNLSTKIFTICVSMRMTREERNACSKYTSSYPAWQARKGEGKGRNYSRARSARRAPLPPLFLLTIRACELGGYSRQFRIGVCRQSSQTLTLFKGRKSRIDTLFKAQNQEMQPYLRETR